MCYILKVEDTKKYDPMLENKFFFRIISDWQHYNFTACQKKQETFLRRKKMGKRRTAVKFLPTCVLTAKLRLLISLVPLGTFAAYKIFHCRTQVVFIINVSNLI